MATRPTNAPLHPPAYLNHRAAPLRLRLLCLLSLSRHHAYWLETHGALYRAGLHGSVCLRMEFSGGGDGLSVRVVLLPSDDARPRVVDGGRAVYGFALVHVSLLRQLGIGRHVAWQASGKLARCSGNEWRATAAKPGRGYARFILDDVSRHHH